ncbi:MAG: hypothetical protein ACTSVI_09145 [Promethearchaeota archaeon]
MKKYIVLFTMLLLETRAILHVKNPRAFKFPLVKFLSNNFLIKCNKDGMKRLYHARNLLFLNAVGHGNKGIHFPASTNQDGSTQTIKS